MPNRLLKESICTSENIDQLTPLQEILFYRLIVNCDDFGRMDARPKILSARLFPLKEISVNQIEEALKALLSAELVILYQVNGKPFLQMKTWDRHQQVRAKRSKYPSPDEGLQTIANNCNQLISDVSKCPRNPIQSNTESKTTTTTTNETADDVDDVGILQIQNDHNEILDAAEDAGFPKNQATWSRIIDLYAEFGKKTVLQGIRACVDHGKTTVAYLKGCCKNANSPVGKPGTGKRNPFEDMLEEMRDDKG